MAAHDHAASLAGPGDRAKLVGPQIVVVEHVANHSAAAFNRVTKVNIRNRHIVDDRDGHGAAFDIAV